jgi:hypothetical protein
MSRERRSSAPWSPGAVAGLALGIAAVGCGGGASNDDVEGTCLPPVPGAVPLTCGQSCACGSGGKCDRGFCVSCHCDADQSCDANGRCVTGHSAPWYSGLLSAVCLEEVARADDVRGLEIAVRTAGGLPYGKVDGTVSDALNRTATSALLFEADAGYRLDPRLLVGAYGSYALARTASALRDACATNGASCSVDDVRVGFQAQIRGLTERPWDPWVGIGAGYEWLRVHAGPQTVTAAGWEFLHVEGGLNIGSHDLGFGPFVAGTVGQYREILGSASSTLRDQAVHEWLVVGVRGVLDIGPRRAPPPELGQWVPPTREAASKTISTPGAGSGVVSQRGPGRAPGEQCASW